jgi:hypothetical protein
MNKLVNKAVRIKDLYFFIYNSFNRELITFIFAAKMSSKSEKSSSKYLRIS